MSDKSDAMLELYDEIKQDHAFDKLKAWQAGIKFVPGRGNLNAAVVFVGEAPGAQEIEKGQPFVGKAGQILDGLLKDACIDRQKVFITNAVKFRPKANRTPWPSELRVACEYLARELEIMKPAVVVLLGAAAVRCVWMPDRAPTISQSHGTFHRRPPDPWTYAIMYHPMALTYGDILEVGKDDMRGLRHWCDMHGISI